MKVKAQITIQSNPRILIPVLISFLIIAALVIMIIITRLFFAGLLIGALVSFILYKILRFVFKQLYSFLAADKEGLTVCEYGEEIYKYPWEQVTVSGSVYFDNGSNLLYAYIKTEDRLFTISREFNNFDALRDKLKSYMVLTDIKLKANETLAQHLAKKLRI